MSKNEETAEIQFFDPSFKTNKIGKDKLLQKLSNMRVIQKCLVYVIGLSADLIAKEVKFL
jgi:hypothetical protein